MSAHTRKVSARAPLPRRSTRGPLDADDDPLSPSSSSLASSMIKSPISPSPATPTASHSPQTPVSSLPPPTQPEPTPTLTSTATTASDRDLSFLLFPHIYHPLPLSTIPPPLRQHLPPLPAPNTPPDQTLNQIHTHLTHHQYLAAAYLTHFLLTTRQVPSLTTSQVTHLLTLRFTTLHLLNLTHLAAQESKSLEDLSSDFYYLTPPASPILPTSYTLNTTTTATNTVEALPASHHTPTPRTHILPFPLRLLALSLQAIGFADPRRGIASLYDLASECREWIAFPHISEEEREIWRGRLAECGERAVAGLVGMGEFEAGRGVLEGLRPARAAREGLRPGNGVRGKREEEEEEEEKWEVEERRWKARMGALLVRMGRVGEARALLQEGKEGEEGGKGEDEDREGVKELQMVRALCAVADEDWPAATTMLKEMDEGAERVAARQNLGVAMLYQGDIAGAREVLEGLVDEGYVNATLTVNLATVYELMSERAKELKIELVERVAELREVEGREKEGGGGRRVWGNADFKL